MPAPAPAPLPLTRSSALASSTSWWTSSVVWLESWRARSASELSWLAWDSMSCGYPRPLAVMQPSPRLGPRLRAGRAARLDSAHAHAPDRLAPRRRRGGRRVRQQQRRHVVGLGQRRRQHRRRQARRRGPRQGEPAPQEPRPGPGDRATLPLKSSGTLTIGTDKPAYPPYFEDDKPTNGKGFESAVAY